MCPPPPRQLLPAVAFCFSKKKVDALADMLPHLDFATSSEKSKIHLFFEKAVTRLKGTDRDLPQILRLREMLKRGLGVHHAGVFIGFAPPPPCPCPAPAPAPSLSTIKMAILSTSFFCV